LPGRDFPHATTVEGLRFTAQVAAPNVIQGLFRRRRSAVAVATKTGADGLAVSFMAGLRRSYGDGPVWIRVGTKESLLLLGVDPIRRALENSPELFASDAEPKRSGMRHFQPDALTISRNPLWSDRRAFCEAVLDTREPEHRLAPRFAEVCVEEAARVPAMLDWDSWNRTLRRVARRVIIGDRTADEDRLSEWLADLMSHSNPPGNGQPTLYRELVSALDRYVAEADPDSLVGLFAGAPQTPRTKPAGQVIHWLFALGDTLAINALRCLALLAVAPAAATRAAQDPAYLDACLQEAMRLWPTTPILTRRATRDLDWDGVRLPAGTQLLIVNSFNHRDRRSNDYANRFEPEAWLTGGARDVWLFNHFSHGPQDCPGAGLAMLVGRETLGHIVRTRQLRLLEPRLSTKPPLPHALDYFELKFELTLRAQLLG
jgi:cytochrome P450